MNIKDFEQYFDETILARGLSYNKSGNIMSLEYDGEEWIAEAGGSYDYTVTVTLSYSNDILESEYDCPYDLDSYYKHQAAVFYALRNNLKL